MKGKPYTKRISYAVYVKNFYCSLPLEISTPLINIQRGPISSVLQIKIVVSGFLSESLNLPYFRCPSSEWVAKCCL